MAGIDLVPHSWLTHLLTGFSLQLIATLPREQEGRAPRRLRGDLRRGQPAQALILVRRLPDPHLAERVARRDCEYGPHLRRHARHELRLVRHHALRHFEMNVVTARWDELLGSLVAR